MALRLFRSNSGKVKRAMVSLCAVTAIPLGDASLWQDLAFRKIPKNQVKFEKTTSGEVLTVDVKKSASPLIYPLPQAQKVQKVSFSLAFTGGLQGAAPKQEFEEDSVFRLGLVVKGTKTLNAFQKLIAPDWVKKLFSLAPPGSGVDRIVFLKIGRDRDMIGKTRQHPASELIEERVIAVREGPSPELKVTHVLQEPLEATAVWISIDGDQTQSEYQVKVTSITLE